MKRKQLSGKHIGIVLELSLQCMLARLTLLPKAKRANDNARHRSGSNTRRSGDTRRPITQPPFPLCSKFSMMMNQSLWINWMRLGCSLSRIRYLGLIVSESLSHTDNPEEITFMLEAEYVTLNRYYPQAQVELIEATLLSTSLLRVHTTILWKKWRFYRQTFPSSLYS